MELGIVVLNFLNYQDTIECVESILRQSKMPKEIVIVDNCSTNNSIQLLEEKFKRENAVSIIKAKKNLGFAQGNNLGIKYCRKNNIDNILVINNDTILEDSFYLEKLSLMDLAKNIGILGTSIIGKDGLNQNPIYICNNLKGLLKRLNYLLFSDSAMYKFLKKFKRVQEPSKYKNSNSFKVTNEYILHGAALLFTKNFFEYYEGFYPDTFLYVEENILDFMLKKAGLKFSYYDKIQILHKEDMSSGMSFNNDRKIYKNFMKDSTIAAIRVYFSSLSSIKKRIDESIANLEYVKVK